MTSNSPGRVAGNVEQPKFLVDAVLVLPAASLQRAASPAERPVQALVAPGGTTNGRAGGASKPIDRNDDRPLKALGLVDRHDSRWTAPSASTICPRRSRCGRPIVVQVARELHEPANSIVPGALEQPSIVSERSGRLSTLRPAKWRALEVRSLASASNSAGVVTRSRSRSRAILKYSRARSLYDRRVGGFSREAAIA